MAAFIFELLDSHLVLHAYAGFAFRGPLDSPTHIQGHWDRREMTPSELVFSWDFSLGGVCEMPLGLISTDYGKYFCNGTHKEMGVFDGSIHSSVLSQVLNRGQRRWLVNLESLRIFTFGKEMHFHLLFSCDLRNRLFLSQIHDCKMSAQYFKMTNLIIHVVSSNVSLS